jgi:hypothetical protein
MCGRIAAKLPPEFIRHLYTTTSNLPNLSPNLTAALTTGAVIISRDPESGEHRLDAVRLRHLQAASHKDASDCGYCHPGGSACGHDDFARALANTRLHRRENGRWVVIFPRPFVLGAKVIRAREHGGWGRRARGTVRRCEPKQAPRIRVTSGA